MKLRIRIHERLSLKSPLASTVKAAIARKVDVRRNTVNASKQALTVQNSANATAV
jgi:hypothetical protein